MDYKDQFVARERMLSENNKLRSEMRQELSRRGWGKVRVSDLVKEFGFCYQSASPVLSIDNARLFKENRRLEKAVVFIRGVWEPPVTNFDDDAGMNEIDGIIAENERLKKEVDNLRKTWQPLPSDQQPKLEPPAEPPSDVEQMVNRIDRLEGSDSELRNWITDLSKKGPGFIADLVKRIEALERWQNRHHNDTGPLELAGKVKELEAALGAPHSALPLNTQVFNMSERLDKLEEALKESSGDFSGSAEGLSRRLQTLEAYAKRIEDGYTRGQHKLTDRVAQLEVVSNLRPKPDEADTRAKLANM